MSIKGDRRVQAMFYRLKKAIHLCLIGFVIYSLLACKIPPAQKNPPIEELETTNQQIPEEKPSTNLSFRRLWTFSKKGEENSHSVIFALDNPVYAKDKVYVHVTCDGLYALDIATGEEIWHFATDACPGHTLAANEKVVYVGAWDFYAVNAEDGTLLWSIPSGGACDSWGHPLIVDETLYLAQGGQIQSTGQDFLHALELETGKSKWKYQASSSIIGPPAIGNGLVYFGSSDGWFYALDAVTGKEEWKVQLPCRIASQPVVDKEKVYFQATDVTFDKGIYKVYALDAFTGKEQWNFTTIGDNLINIPSVVYQGMLYVSGGSLYSIDTQTGKEVWSYPSWGKIPFTIANDQVYFGDDALYVLDPKTGSTIKVFQKGILFPETPILVEKDIIVFGDEYGTLYAIQEK
jgi:eukaryotic-like serine/threonine-protein kinase